MQITLLSDVAYMGAPHSKFYLVKDRKTRSILYQDEYGKESKLPDELGIYLWQSLMRNIEEHPAPEGHHYDIWENPDKTRKRIGIEATNVSLWFSDLA